jgi:hypothetical protein
VVSPPDLNGASNEKLGLLPLSSVPHPMGGGGAREMGRRGGGWGWRLREGNEEGGLVFFRIFERGGKGGGGWTKTCTCINVL